MPKHTPDALDQALEAMLSQVKPSPPVFTAGDEVDLLVDMVRSSSNETELELPDKESMTSAYYPFSVKVSMDRLLRYGYNPDLPNYILAPNTVRHGAWTSVNGQDKPLPRLWEHLGHLDEPVVVHGVEHEEITPDMSTGGYYSYDMDRALILLPHEAGPVLISITRQDDKSDVGKKGAVVGNDADWQYLYSGVDGLTKGGLGWVSSYMYGAMSVTIFCEVPTPEGMTIKAGVFKWLRAGWAGINMVRPHHIEEGCERFATAMQAILESPELPSEDVMAEQVDICENLTPGELRGLVKPYIEQIKNVDDPVVRKSPFKKMLDSGEYLAKMPKEDMVKILVQGYLKEILGQESPVDASACRTLAGQRTASKR
ncbi:hypothetical protein ACTVJH_05510 [Desulfoplanes sp. PS50]